MTASPLSLFDIEHIEEEDTNEIGELGYILSTITKAKIPVSEALVIPASIYRDFIKQNGFHVKIPHLLAHANFRHIESIHSASNNIKRIFLEADLRSELIKNIFRQYEILNGFLKNNLFSIYPAFVPHTLHHPAPKTIAPFWGEANMLLKIKEAWSEAFTPEAIVYRNQNNINHFTIGASLLIQKVINSDSSGVFTINKTKSGNSHLIIKAQLGIYNPEEQFDEYRLLFNDGLIDKKIVNNQTKMLKVMGNKLKPMNIRPILGNAQKISDKNLLDIFKLSTKLKDLYYLPKDYFFDIEKNRIYITNVKPKVFSDGQGVIHSERHIESGSPLAKGLSTGPARIINTFHDLKNVTRGEILILKKEIPELKDVISKCNALLFKEKLTKPHLNHLLNKKTIPAVSNLTSITSKVKNGQILTVNGTKGDIIKGGLLKSNHYNSSTYNKTATKIYLDLSDTFLNEQSLTEDHDGIGILSGNGLIRFIGIHPKSFIEKRNKAEFIQLLSSNIENALKLFQSKTIMYALSDLESADLRNLKDGKQFEAIEKNPFIGFRGSVRHIRDRSPFLLELSAVKYLRDTLEYKNLHLILPLIRNVSELREIAKIMRSENIYKSANLKIWMKISTPLQVLCISQFIEEGLDGIIIDTDSLHTLLAGVDKDNIELMNIYDKIDPGLESYIETIINTSKKHELHVSIYTSALSMQEKLIEKLIKFGISSIVVKSSQVPWIKEVILKSERKITNKEL